MNHTGNVKSSRNHIKGSRSKFILFNLVYPKFDQHVINIKIINKISQVFFCTSPLKSDVYLRLQLIQFRAATF